jgi:hypothetical protein
MSKTEARPRRYQDFFFFGIFAPDFLASLRAIATACLRLVTFLPLLDFSVPSFFSFITLWILFFPLESELEEDRCVVDLVAINSPSYSRRFGPN